MNCENWKTVRLGDVCEQISGEWGQDCSDGKGTKVLRTTNFTNIGILKYDDVVERLIPQNKIDTKQLKKGDIILEKSGGSDTQPVGRVVYFDRDDDVFLCNNFTTALRISDDSVFSKYVFDYMFYMHKIGITEYYQNKTTGIRNLQTKAYLDRKIPLPPLATQKHIATVLDKCTALIAKHKLMLEKYDTLVKSQFVEMFGDPKVNSSNLPTKKSVDIVKLQRGFDLPVQERNQNGTICVFGSNGVLDKHDIYKVKAPGIVTGRSGTIGNVYYTLKDYWPLNTTLFSVDTHNNNVIYLKYLLDLFDLSRFSEGAGVPTLNRNIVHDKELIDVPLALQQKFAQFVQAVDAQKAKAQKSLEKAEILYKALMQRYFA